MKNRKLFITSFLLVATLIVGVGFANIAGNMTITGNAAFYGHELIEDTTLSALHFSAVESSDNCKVELVTNNLGLTHDATMYVNFYATDEVTTEFTATATFTITYGTPGAALPDIQLGTLAASAAPDAGIQGEFTCTSVWTDGGGTAAKTLTPGQSVQVTVTVKYTKPNNAEVHNQSFDATIHATIPYTTDTSGS